MPAGRPTAYKDHYPDKAYEFCAEFGMTDKKLARLFDVSVATIYVWKKEYPEFLESIKKGKDDYDSVNIEKSLRRRANGFRFSEKTKELVDGEMTETKIVGKFVPPDPTSMIFWLKNRHPERWRDKHDFKVEGNLEINLIDSFADDDE